MMKNNRKLLSVLIFISGVSFSGFSALVLNEIRIENIDNTTLDESFVKMYTSLRAGQQIESEAGLSEAVAHDVDNLRRSERFSYVRAVIEQDGDKFTLIYKVAGRLRLSQINITGAEGIGNRKIKKELGLELGDYVDAALVGENVRKVEAYCRKNKYPDATVAWELKPDEQTGTANLVLNVTEGEKLRVKKISFEGERLSNDSFWRRMVPNIFPSKKRAARYEPRDLRKVMQQKKTWWITPWFGAYKPEMKEADLESLRKFYQDRGFLDVRVDGPELKQLGDGKLELVYRIQEGIKYQIGPISFDGNTLYETAELEKQVTVKPGEVASRTAINDAAASVNRYYGNRGYIRNDVYPAITTDPATKTASIRFSVREGEPADINEIDIRGNEKTRDEVMRRELAVYPGELYNQQNVETSESRLKNLGYFETVSSSYTPAAATNTYDLVFKVKEKAMGSFLIGAGFSSIDSLVGFAELSHGNFDIKRWPPVGDGQKIKIRVQAGTKRNDLEVSFIEPWFMDRKLALGQDFYYRTAGYYSDQFDLETVGSKTSLTKPVFDPFTRGSVSYSLEQFTVDNIDSSVPVAAKLQEDEGAHLKSAVGASLSRDTRDQFYIPTRGNYSSVGAELAGAGGDQNTYMLEAKSSQFWPVLDDHVFNLKGEIRTIDSWDGTRVPIYDRLFLGGPRTIRGFAYRDVSPRDPINGNEPDGGLSSWYATAEYTVPLWSKIRGAVFYDIGAVAENSFDLATDINSSYGVGVRIDLPMFPLRLDYAIPQITDDNNTGASGRFSFLLGYSF